MLALGNDEMAEMPPLKIGEAILCPHCGGAHVVSGGRDEEGEVTDSLLFYCCEEAGSIFLAGVNGKNIMSRFMKGES